jgi:hypothetical protein
MVSGALYQFVSRSPPRKESAGTIHNRMFCMLYAVFTRIPHLFSMPARQLIHTVFLTLPAFSRSTANAPVPACKLNSA